MKRLDRHTLAEICDLADIPSEAQEDFAEDLHNARVKAVHHEAFEALANEVDDGDPGRAIELAAELEAEVGPHPDLTYYRVLAQRLLNGGSDR